MSDHDYIDHTYVGFDAQSALIVKVVKENTSGSTPLWPHIQAEAITEIETLYTDFHVKHVAAEAPTHNKIDVEERSAARKHFEPVLRNFCQRFFYDAPSIVTDAQLESMNLRIRDKTRTTHGKPQWRVVIEIEPSKTRTHTIRWRVAETGSKAIPLDCNGWVLAYKALSADEPAPTDPEDFGHSQLVTRNPFVVEHKPGDEGKRIAYCGVFQSSSRGLKGDWGEIVVAVLP
ncbi:MAG: hypothetical protein LBK25_06355 [Treponema sp.]|jgi:hypothetical protein|nr:hypothetical protein [Treponema sp.]